MKRSFMNKAEHFCHFKGKDGGPNACKTKEVVHELMRIREQILNQDLIRNTLNAFSRTPYLEFNC